MRQTHLLAPSTNRFAVYTGHGVVGTTHSENVETLVNRVIEQGLPSYLLEEIDLVVFPHHVDGERYVAEAVEFVDADPGDLDDRSAVARPGLPAGVVEKDGRRIRWNVVAERDVDGGFRFDYAHPELGDPERELGVRVLHRIAETTDRPLEAVEDEFHRKHRYVEYLVREGIDDFEELFAFVSDLRTDEAATVERVRRELAAEEEPATEETVAEEADD